MAAARSGAVRDKGGGGCSTSGQLASSERLAEIHLAAVAADSPRHELERKGGVMACCVARRPQSAHHGPLLAYLEMRCASQMPPVPEYRLCAPASLLHLSARHPAIAPEWPAPGFANSASPPEDPRRWTTPVTAAAAPAAALQRVAECFGASGREEARGRAQMHLSHQVHYRDRYGGGSVWWVCTWTSRWNRSRRPQRGASVELRAAAVAHSGHQD